MKTATFTLTDNAAMYAASVPRKPKGNRGKWVSKAIEEKWIRDGGYPQKDAGNRDTL